MAVSVFAAPVFGVEIEAKKPLRDPTEPSGVVVKVNETKIIRESNPQLTAIFISGERRTAIIDGQVLSVGDKLGTKRVKEIGQYSVKLDDKGKETILNLLESPFKENAH